MSKMIAFNDNYSDDSTDAGFTFTFFCDKCNEGYKTGFIASKTYKKKRALRQHREAGQRRRLPGS